MNKEQLQELFKYDDGLIWIKVSKYNTRHLGKFAGSLQKNGYYRVRINGVIYQLHRMVWIYHNGDISNGMMIDHIDGDKSNNRIENLRLATNSQNQYNRKICSKNTSGVKGVHWRNDTNKWTARFENMGKKINLGCFIVLEEAEAAIIAARNNLHGEFARHE